MIVGVPVQVPAVALATWPSRSVPLIDGATVFAGAAAVTTAVCADVALALPPAFVPVTTTRMVWPTSAAPWV